MGIQAVEFGMSTRGKYAVDGVLVGADEIRARLDADVEACKPRDSPFFRNVISSGSRNSSDHRSEAAGNR
jgi:hypothetical protein